MACRFIRRSSSEFFCNEFLYGERDLPGIRKQNGVFDPQGVRIPQGVRNPQVVYERVGVREPQGVRSSHCVAISIFLSDFAPSLFVASRVLSNEEWRLCLSK
jgi:hypothetical protein